MNNSISSRNFSGLKPVEMARRQKLQYMMLVFTYFAVLQEIVNASNVPHPSFTCGPNGIKHDTNDSETLGGTPNVDMTCPKLPIKMDAHTEIACEVLSKTFANITWFHNRQPISKQRKSHVTVDRKSCYQTLKIKFVTTSDGGNYTCQVANANGNVNKTCVLDVKAHTTEEVQIGYVKIAGNRQKAILQGSVVLKCSMLHAQAGVWLRNSERITDNERQVYRHERMFGAKVMMLYLEIVNVTKNDEGLYTCLGYRNGRQANKTFYLETEPCPSGYICPHEGNTAIRIPAAVLPGSNGVFVAQSKSKGSCSVFQAA
ncbi:contactin-4-like isoform X3 [Orbicella faveolata]|nr:contactin-4-like isoform X3 [Orbicella faveolata]